MTAPDRTEELVEEMLARRAGGDIPADLLGSTLLALAGAHRARGGDHRAVTARRLPRRHVLLVAGLAAAIPVLVVALVATGSLLTVGPGDDDRVAAATAEASPGPASPTPDATPAPSSATPPSTGESPATGLAIDSLALVTVEGDDLRVRSTPTVDDSSRMFTPLLPAGTRLLVVGGPVRADGMEWYRVQTDGELINLFGWVSTGKDGETWVVPVRPRCREEVNAATVAELNRIEFLACYGDTPVQVRARAADLRPPSAETSDCGWARRKGACRVDQRWLLFPTVSATLVTDRGNQFETTLAMHPNMAAQLHEVPTDSPLLLTIAMDPAEAASCRVRDQGSGSDVVPAERAITACRLQFEIREIRWLRPGEDSPGG